MERAELSAVESNPCDHRLLKTNQLLLMEFSNLIQYNIPLITLSIPWYPGTTWLK